MGNLLVLRVSQPGMEAAPEVIKLIPLGQVESQKGTFLADEESLEQINRQFKARGIDLVVDYEHQTLKDVQAPAAGWIKELFLQDGAISAKVEWTKKAEEYLKNREYRYLSPVIRNRKQDGKVIGLHSVALTNTPAINHMFSIVASDTFQGPEELGGSTMDLEKLIKLLGLAKGATEEEILKAMEETVKSKGEKQDPVEGEALVANKTLLDLLGLKAGAATEDVAAAIMALKAGARESEQAAGLEKRVKELEYQIAKRESEDAVALALKAGKITPAQKDWAVEYALKDSKGFAAFADKAPQVVPLGEIEYAQTALKEGKLDEATMAISKMMGISEDDFRKYGKEK